MNTLTYASEPSALDSRRWPALVVLLTGTMLPPLDFFIVNVALPAIRIDLRASSDVSQLVISVYAAAYAVTLILGGRLGDLYGRKRVFVGGMFGFYGRSRSRHDRISYWRRQRKRRSSSSCSFSSLMSRATISLSEASTCWMNSIVANGFGWTALLAPRCSTHIVVRAGREQTGSPSGRLLRRLNQALIPPSTRIPEPVT